MLSFDFEGDFLSKEVRDGYTAVAQETATALKTINTTLSVCVGGRPTYEFRNCDYVGLAATADFLFVMGTDVFLMSGFLNDTHNQATILVSGMTALA